MMTSRPIDPKLLPITATFDAGGRMSIGGCDLLDLAAEFGTPLFVYDEEHLREKCREAVKAFGSIVHFATKSFLCRAMAKLAYEEGMHLDVSTGGEYFVVRSAGVPASAIVLHGNNKSYEELRTAISENVNRIVVDSFDELTRIKQIVDEGGRAPKILLRITPGIEAHTHEFVQTGQDDSKFGFGVANGHAKQAVEMCLNAPYVDLCGIHTHIGSQIYDEESFGKAIDIMAPFLHDYALQELSVGGGLGVAYTQDEAAPTFEQWAEAIHNALERNNVDIKITAEPGRSIVANAAVTLYTVGTMKHLPKIRTYLSVDGGMSDNPRPVLYGSGYEIFCPDRSFEQRSEKFTVVGKHCESGDVLIKDARLPSDVGIGDIVCTPVTGAYGYSMASNYNRVPRPAVLFVKDGVPRVVIRRETFQDLLHCDEYELGIAP